MRHVSTLQAVLVKQSRLRAFIGIPMTGVLVWLHYYADRALLWAEWAIVCYFVYIAATSVLSLIHI